MLGELVDRVGEVLDGARPAPRRPPRSNRGCKRSSTQAGGRILVQGELDRVVVVAPDRPGLFCHLAGVLALQGLDVLAADVQSSTDGMAVDEFRVHQTHRDAPDWDRFRDNVEKVLDGRLALEARLAERARRYNTRLGRSAGVAVHAARHVAQRRVGRRVGRGGSSRRTRSACSTGSRVRSTTCSLDIRHAKVQTLGDEVVDSFYVVDQAGAKLDEQRAVRRVAARRALRALARQLLAASHACT